MENAVKGFLTTYSLMNLCPQQVLLEGIADLKVNYNNVTSFFFFLE